jgi:hypothetical protein
MAQNTRSYATNFQLWRLNCLGLLDLRDEPVIRWSALR